MSMKKNSAQTVPQYIADFPKEVQRLLKEVRATIRKAAPTAEEMISYGIPTYKLNGNLVHFGGYAKHIGFYPGPPAMIAFKKELSEYKTSKGAVQFSLDKKIPVALIAKITRHRVKEQKNS